MSAFIMLKMKILGMKENGLKFLNHCILVEF